MLRSGPLHVVSRPVQAGHKHLGLLHTTRIQLCSRGCKGCQTKGRAAMQLAANGHAAAAAATTNGVGQSGVGTHSNGLMNPVPFIPISVMTDSYKASHFLQYPAAKKMIAYGEFRQGFEGDSEDTRIIYFGLRYILENYIMRPWTEVDVERADLFYRSHLAPAGGPFPYPKDLFLKFVRENDGYFPVKMQALEEGTCVHAHVPVYQITAEEEYSPLCTFLETLLTMLWYPSTVATSSRRARDVIAAAFDSSVNNGQSHPLLNSRLHDFGFRGCTSVEQSIIGGCAHLLNFEGTDTMPAAYYAQFHLNSGKPVGSSIPATEHSVMTCWPDEKAAIINMIEQFGTGVFATVMDSYDYTAALEQVVPVVAQKKLQAGGFWVLRPDSGDPVEVVVQALHALDKVFGSDVNSKGYKVVRGASVIQGDGITIVNIRKILEAVLAASFSAQNVAFGMGGGLLQRVNRDTLSFATKLCHVVYPDGSKRDIMKQPTTDASKISFPGALAVKRVNCIPTVFPADSGEVLQEEDMLQVVYDNGPVPHYQWDNYDTLRSKVAQEWAALPKRANVVSASLRQKVAAVCEQQEQQQQQQQQSKGGGKLGSRNAPVSAAKQ